MKYRAIIIVKKDILFYFLRGNQVPTKQWEQHYLKWSTALANSNLKPVSKAVDSKAVVSKVVFFN